VWPENAPSVELFQRISTQWRHGFAGPSGLDYTALYPVMAHMGLHGRAWFDALDDIRVMELAALTQMAENKAEN